ncbi:MAG: hypothetical protein ACLUEQ_04820 [Cloacibacillus evryensis]
MKPLLTAVAAAHGDVHRRSGGVRRSIFFASRIIPRGAVDGEAVLIILSIGSKSPSSQQLPAPCSSCRQISVEPLRSARPRIPAARCVQASRGVREGFTAQTPTRFIIFRVHISTAMAR